jgi:hypothetical protein
VALAEPCRDTLDPWGMEPLRGAQERERDLGILICWDESLQELCIPLELTHDQWSHRGVDVALFTSYDVVND